MSNEEYKRELHAIARNIEAKIVATGINEDLFCVMLLIGEELDAMDPDSEV